MSYREMAIDAGASGEDEIRQLAKMIEADHREDFERCQREQEASGADPAQEEVEREGAEAEGLARFEAGRQP